MLSVVIPVYNERDTLATVLAAVAGALPGIPKEIVVVRKARPIDDNKKSRWPWNEDQVEIVAKVNDADKSIPRLVNEITPMKKLTS